MVSLPMTGCKHQNTNHAIDQNILYPEAGYTQTATAFS